LKGRLLCAKLQHLAGSLSFGRPFLLKVTWLAFGLGKLDCDENRKISRNEGDAFDQE
jgi:hypothetical protein